MFTAKWKGPEENGEQKHLGWVDSLEVNLFLGDSSSENVQLCLLRIQLI